MSAWITSIVATWAKAATLIAASTSPHCADHLPGPDCAQLAAGQEFDAASEPVVPAPSDGDGRVPSPACPAGDGKEGGEKTLAAADHIAGLRWDRAVNIAIEDDAYEMVLRFDHALDDAEIERFAKAAGDNLADLRWNDATLVMRPASGFRIEAIAADRCLNVRFIAEGDRQSAPPLAEAGIELAIVQSQADIAAGYPGKGRRRLAMLAARHPGNVLVDRALADSEAAIGWIGAAAQRYRALDADDRYARQIIAEAGGHLSPSLTLRKGKTFLQWEAGLTGIVPLRSDLKIGGGVRQFWTKADGVAASAGILDRTKSYQAMIDLMAELAIAPNANLEVKGSALVDQVKMGLGATLSVGMPERQAKIELAYRLPDMSTAEQAEFGGHLTRIGIGGTIRITPRILAQAELAANGYGLAGRGVNTRTIVARAGVDVLLMRGAPALMLTYRLDAEYVGRRDRYANDLPLVPLTDRENHTVQTILSQPLGNAQLTAAGGWTKDRYGGDGPTASIGAVVRLDEAWRLETTAGVSSVSRPAISGRNYYLRLAVTRFLGRQP